MRTAGKGIEQDFAWSGSGWTQTNEVHYIYDGNLVFQERDKNNNPLTTYTRGIDLSGTLDGAGGIGGLLARSDNQKIVPAILTPVTPNPQNVVTSYYFSDLDGNVVALVSPSGMVLAQYEYDPFGNLISKGGLMADINKYRFSSKEWNDNTGLYYYGYRFYDPNLERWLNRDPIEENGGLNLYYYVGNNSIDFIDPYGQSWAVVWGGVGAVIGGLAGAGISVVVDVGTVGINIAGTPAEIGATAAAGAAVGAAFGHLFDPSPPTRCEARGHGERGIQGKNPNPWKGWRPNPNKTGWGWVKDPQTGKTVAKPRPPGPPPPNHPNW